MPGHVDLKSRILLPARKACFFVICYVRTMKRRKGGAIFDIAGDGAQNNFCTFSYYGLGDVFEITFVVFVNNLKICIVLSNEVFHKHFRAAPDLREGFFNLFPA